MHVADVGDTQRCRQPRGLQPERCHPNALGIDQRPADGDARQGRQHDSGAVCRQRQQAVEDLERHDQQEQQEAGTEPGHGPGGDVPGRLAGSQLVGHPAGDRQHQDRQ